MTGDRSAAISEQVERRKPHRPNTPEISLLPALTAREHPVDPPHLDHEPSRSRLDLSRALIPSSLRTQ